ncbi:MAG TPA: hypothetical protein VFV37_02370 [Luteibaculaceae bacterium]|nr:hypothetical protein [Luteibaculaceae bacterium]
MSELSALLQNPQVYYLNQVVIEDVVAQLRKDLDTIELEVVWEVGETPYQSVYKALFPVVDYLMEKNPERLFQLFYRIDIPEHIVRNVLLGSVEDLCETYCDLILNRELQKVIIRRYYAQSL